MVWYIGTFSVLTVPASICSYLCLVLSDQLSWKWSMLGRLVISRGAKHRNKYREGLTGRLGRRTRSCTAPVVDLKQKKWVEFLPFVTAAYNSTSHCSTTFSPNFLMFGRELNSAVDIAFGCPRPAACSTNDYALHTRELMAEAYAIVREHLGRNAEVMKSSYDAAVKPAQFQVDDQVWYFCPRSRPGTSPKWTR